MGADGWAIPAGDDIPQAYCERGIAGGGWRLISARQRDQGALFGDDICSSPFDTCSGHLPAEESCPPEHGQILLASVAGGVGDVWLAISSNSVLHDFLARQRELRSENFCHEPHFCELLPEPLAIVEHSSNFEPLADHVASLWVMSGGLAMRAEDGRVIAAFNLAPYGGTNGALYISSANAGEQMGDVVAGAPGALFHRCRAR